MNTNPAFLRAVIGKLRDAGLVATKLGKGGGATLARPAAEITLLDVYRATGLDPSSAGVKTTHFSLYRRFGDGAPPECVM